MYNKNYFLHIFRQLILGTHGKSMDNGMVFVLSVIGKLILTLYENKILSGVDVDTILKDDNV